MLAEVWKHLSTARHGRDVTLSVKTNGPIECDVDARAIQQVFRNIIENALNVCSDLATIDMRAWKMTLRQRDAIKIAFHNNGPQLTHEQQMKMFEPFFTTDTKGTGLGMTIAKRIVEGHGGSLRASNSVPHGVVFVITLPRIAPENPSLS